MNDFLIALPWRLASLSALVVGAVSFATGDVDVWTGIERAGIAFAVFFVIGLFARILVSTGTTDPPAVKHLAADPDGLAPKQDRTVKNADEQERSKQAPEDANTSI